MQLELVGKYSLMVAVGGFLNNVTPFSLGQCVVNM